MNQTQDTRIASMLETYSAVHGKPSAMRLDSLVFIALNMFSVKLVADLTRKHEPAMAETLDSVAETTINRVVELCLLSGIKREDFLSCVRALSRDIGDGRADADKKQG